jgi:Uma2 family endonuclease
MRFTDDDYLEGAPEFAAEVASSTEAYDLHSKKRDYEQAGVKEYLVIALRQKTVFWFVNQDGRFVEQDVDASGHYCSSVFPGLWLDPNAIIELNSQQLLATLREGLVTPEHAAFVQQLG